MSEMPTEGLSENSKEILSRYFAWAKKQQTAHMKDIEGEAQEFRAASLVDDSYNKADVKDILNGLTTILKVTIEKEQRDGLNSLGELLRQVLLGSDKAGVTASVDMAALDDPSSLGTLSGAFSGASLLKKTNLLAPAAKLPDLAPIKEAQEDNQKTTEELARTTQELVKMTEERDKLNDKVQKIQQQYTLMMGEKSKLTQEVGKLRDATTANDATIQARVKELQGEIDVMKNTIEKKDAELAGTAKELTSKVNNTNQFKTLKKLLTQKNQQIKTLRASLLKYEPAGSGCIELEDDDSTDED